jgi:hypothetical protein
MNSNKILIRTGLVALIAIANKEGYAQIKTSDSTLIINTILAKKGLNWGTFIFELCVHDGNSSIIDTISETSQLIDCLGENFIVGERKKSMSGNYSLNEYSYFLKLEYSDLLTEYRAYIFKREKELKEIKISDGFIFKKNFVKYDGENNYMIKFLQNKISDESHKSHKSHSSHWSHYSSNTK